MSESTPNPDAAERSRFSWRSFFHRSVTPIFVLGPSRRLRYVNPAWEKLTGRQFEKVRGMRVSSRRSGSVLGQALAATPEVWAGHTTQVRRAVPPAEAGPPWWDITFVPLLGEGKLLGVVGFLKPSGESLPRGVKPILPTELAELRREHAQGFTFELFAGRTLAAERLLSQLRLAAQVNTATWLIGEPGTGKETAARVIHHQGPTRERAFLGIDCNGVQPYLFEGLFFGRTGLSNSDRIGTVYLKDPAALPRDFQERITNFFLQEPGSRARLICGSCHPAAHEVRSGRLIPPFLTTFSALEISLPPLRSRIDDLPTIAARLMARFTPESRPNFSIRDDALSVLQVHEWPGNLRELSDVLNRAFHRAGEGAIAKEHLPRYLREKHLIASVPRVSPGLTQSLDQVLETVERRLIELALQKSGYSQTDAAEMLGIFRARLGRRIEALGIPMKSNKPKGP